MKRKIHFFIFFIIVFFLAIAAFGYALSNTVVVEKGDLVSFELKDMNASGIVKSIDEKGNATVIIDFYMYKGSYKIKTMTKFTEKNGMFYCAGFEPPPKGDKSYDKNGYQTISVFSLMDKRQNPMERVVEKRYLHVIKRQAETNDLAAEYVKLFKPQDEIRFKTIKKVSFAKYANSKGIESLKKKALALGYQINEEEKIFSKPIIFARATFIMMTDTGDAVIRINNTYTEPLKQSADSILESMYMADNDNIVIPRANFYKYASLYIEPSY